MKEASQRLPVSVLTVGSNIPVRTGTVPVKCTTEYIEVLLDNPKSYETKTWYFNKRAKNGKYVSRDNKNYYLELKIN